MKDLIGKLKGMNYKEFFLHHGEKIGLGVAGVIALTCLAITNWAGYAGTPTEMTDKADTVSRQLTANKWPEQKQAEFTLATAENETKKVTNPLELAWFDYTVTPSQKLYQKRQPADEPELVAVQSLRAFSGKMAMETAGGEGSESESGGAPRPRNPADVAAVPAGAIGAAGISGHGGGAAKTSKPAKGAKPAMGHSEGSMSPEMMRAAMGGAMGSGGTMGGVMGGSTTGTARGQRFNVVVGYVDRRRQLDKLYKALHLETPGQAAEFLEYVSFKIERQRAVPGDDPWTGEWKPLNIESSMEVLSEAADFDAELVAADYTYDVFTEPLPRRVDAEWDPKMVVHPRIPTLNDEDREREQKLNAAAAEVVNESGEAEDRRTRRGFSKLQRDAVGLRRSAMNLGGMDRMMEAMGGMADAGMGAATSRGMPRGAAGGGHGGEDPRRMMAMSGMPGMNSGMGMGAGTGMGMGMGMGMVGMGADVLLFRYFDFDVEPGECYRYRVSLELVNPSYESAYVSQPEVAQGETRWTKPSEASTAAAVERDVEYFLAKVPKVRGKKDGAELNVFQFDTDVGSQMNGTVRLQYGQYVGGKPIAKVMHLKPAVPSMEEEEVNFSSKDLLVDSTGATALPEKAVKDLGLSRSQLQELVDKGGLDQAITIDRFGELVPLGVNPGSPDLAEAKKRLETERKPFEYLKDAPAPGGAGGLEATDSFRKMIEGTNGPSGKKGSKAKGSNPLRMSSMGAMMGMPGMDSGGGGGHGGGGGKAKTKSSKKTSG